MSKSLSGRHLVLGECRGEIHHVDFGSAAGDVEGQEAAFRIAARDDHPVLPVLIGTVHRREEVE